MIETSQGDRRKYYATLPGGAIFMDRDPLGFVDGMNDHTLYQMLFEGLDPSGLEEEKPSTAGRIFSY